MAALSDSGERISITRLHGTRVATSDSTDEEGEEEKPKRTTDPGLTPSQTELERGLRPMRRPQGTGDDPFTLGVDDDEDGYLKGDPPNAFDGDRSRTLTFLAEFNQFMLMNRKANIARDPVRKCAYFLSLISGPNVEGWVFLQDVWLEKAEDDDPTAWQTLEQNFRNDFNDYAGPEIAQLAIDKLRMKKGNVDQYIADFERLARRAGYNVDDRTNLRLFAQGLPSQLAESCIDHENPKTFEQWTKAAQRQQKKWLDKQSFRKEVSHLSQPSSDPTRGQFFWRRRDEGNAQGQSGRAPTRHSTSRDPNVMNTSATVRKAMTDAEKQKCRQEGRCFECSQQGHFARDCRKKRLGNDGP